MGDHMSNTAIYLHFTDQTEDAFLFYQSIFGGEFEGDGFSRMGDAPQPEGQPELSEADKKLIMHVSLPLFGNVKLMGSDHPPSLRFNTLIKGNNVSVSVDPGSREETDRLFTALSEGGQVTMPLQEMFWGDYFGTCVDKFGICWMFNCAAKN